ncbi:MAG: hypothetical protein K6G84_01500 [Lachnospiraceae bacterium]|nr:hypothetical protein [Lachnospiraceae bacterium]
MSKRKSRIRWKIGIREPIPTNNITPKNCKHPCPYGNGKNFCFPCMAKLKGARIGVVT